MALEDFESTESLLSLFQYQGMLTLPQIRELMDLPPEESDKALRRRLKKYLMGPSDEVPQALVSDTLRIKRPWVDTKGASTNLYLLTDVGAATLQKITSRGMEPPNPNSKPKNKQHALALTDIAIYIKKNIGDCLVNRSVIFKTEEENNNDVTNTRPDIQFWYTREKFIQFVEFEHTREQNKEILANILYGRMERWQKLFSSDNFIKGGYSKNIMVLFFLDKNDDWTLFLWQRLLHKLLSEGTNGQPLSFNLYWKDFRDFWDKPTLKVEDYLPLLPKSDPEQERKDLENELYFKERGAELLEPLEEGEGERSTDRYLAKNKQDLITLQNYTARQTFLFNQIRRLYQISQDEQLPKAGLAGSSIPWLSIGLLRQWIEQPQMNKLRNRLIDKLNEIDKGYARSLNTASDLVNRMMWDSFFSFFNIAPGGIVEFNSAPRSADDKKNPGDLIVPVVEFSEWEGIFKSERQADETAKAIEWMVKIILKFTGEMGLMKNAKSYMSILKESVTSDFEPPAPKRPGRPPKKPSQ